MIQGFGLTEIFSRITGLYFPFSIMIVAGKEKIILIYSLSEYIKVLQARQ
jgi:hypothetical protein